MVLVNINAVNQWIARYKKDGIKGLNVSAGRASTTFCLKFFI
jgi:transposase